ncbi:hypothetical protein D3C84_711920 [compost metagenome]
MRIPGAAGHQQHRFVFQFAEGAGHIQRVGHHHQAGLVPQLGNHRRRGGAAVDDDPCMLADPRHTGAGDGLLVLGNRLAGIADQLLRQRHRTAVTAQQQAVFFQGGEVLADGHFRGFETLGQLVHTHLALLGEQGEDGVTTLRSVAFRHAKFRFERYRRESKPNEAFESRAAWRSTRRAYSPKAVRRTQWRAAAARRGRPTS